MPRSGGRCWGHTGSGVARYIAPTSLSRGRWQQVELFVRLNTPGQSDGAQRMWIDRVLRGEWTGLRFRDTPTLMLNAVQIRGHVPGGSRRSQKLFVDDIKVTAYTQGVIVPPPVPTRVASVSVVPGSASVQVGQAVQFAATTRDSVGNPLTGRAVTWSLSDPSVATVDGTGRASGVSAGTAIVRATSEGRTGTASLTVATAPPPPPTPVVTRLCCAGTVTSATGATVQFTATAQLEQRFADAGGGSYGAPGRDEQRRWPRYHPGLITA